MKLPGFKQRLIESIWATLIMLDVVACTAWLVPLYLLGVANKPTGRQLISGYVGKAAHNNHRWAIKVQNLIDSVLGKGHCYRAYINGEG